MKTLPAFAFAACLLGGSSAFAHGGSHMSSTTFMGNTTNSMNWHDGHTDHLDDYTTKMTNSHDDHDHKFDSDRHHDRFRFDRRRRLRILEAELAELTALADVTVVTTQDQTDISDIRYKIEKLKRELATAHAW